MIIIFKRRGEGINKARVGKNAEKRELLRTNIFVGKVENIEIISPARIFFPLKEISYTEAMLFRASGEPQKGEN